MTSFRAGPGSRCGSDPAPAGDHRDRNSTDDAMTNCAESAWFSTTYTGVFFPSPKQVPDRHLRNASAESRSSPGFILTRCLTSFSREAAAPRS